VDQTQYHVVLEGRKVGPYDRRTVVGMRIKKTLTSDHVLIGTDGSQLTVGELIGQPRAFNPERSSVSIVQATYTAAVVALDARLIGIPAFKGEAEARVQGGVLRIAGRRRSGLGWKEDRFKLPFADVVHARVRGTQVDLWMRAPQKGPLQRMTLEMFTPEAAGELVDWLPSATPWTGDPLGHAPSVSDTRTMWMAAAGVAGVAIVVVILFALLQRRVI